MSKLYWKSQIIATTDSDLIKFIPSSVGMNRGGLPSGASNVKSTLEYIACNKTGIKDTAIIRVPSSADGRQVITFTNTNFNDNMYVDYYCDKEIEFYQYPTFSGNTISFYIDKIKLPTGVQSANFSATFKIIVKF